MAQVQRPQQARVQSDVVRQRAVAPEAVVPRRAAAAEQRPRVPADVVRQRAVAPGAVVPRTLVEEPSPVRDARFGQQPGVELRRWPAAVSMASAMAVQAAFESASLAAPSTLQVVERLRVLVRRPALESACSSMASACSLAAPA
jgi:hypothetical protein